jgi:AraC family transcriptional regulator
MDPAFAQHDFELPPFLASERMDKASYLRPSPGFGGMSAGLYQKTTVNPGVFSDPNPCEPVYMLPVLLRDVPAHDAWKDGHHFHSPELPTGAISFYHMLHEWQVDLCFPFNSVHFYIPQGSFDDLTRELRVPHVTHLNCSPTDVIQDPIAYHLALAIAPLIDGPATATSLLSDQILAAIRLHVACTYGGVRPIVRPSGVLSPIQLSRIYGLLLDDLHRDVRLQELADACDLPLRDFQRRFRRSFGRSPYRWRLERKVEYARTLVDFSDQPLVEIAQVCGFADQSHLTRAFSQIVGTAPAAYRRLRDA